MIDSLKISTSNVLAFKSTLYSFRGKLTNANWRSPLFLRSILKSMLCSRRQVWTWSLRQEHWRFCTVSKLVVLCSIVDNNGDSTTWPKFLSQTESRSFYLLYEVIWIHRMISSTIINIDRVVIKSIFIHHCTNSHSFTFQKYRKLVLLVLKEKCVAREIQSIFKNHFRFPKK